MLIFMFPTIYIIVWYEALFHTGCIYGELKSDYIQSGTYKYYNMVDVNAIEICMQYEATFLEANETSVHHVYTILNPPEAAS